MWHLNIFINTPMLIIFQTLFILLSYNIYHAMLSISSVSFIKRERDIDYFCSHGLFTQATSKGHLVPTTL